MMGTEVLAVLNGGVILAIVGLLMRTESRITKLETLVQLLEQRHLRGSARTAAGG